MERLTTSIVNFSADGMFRVLSQEERMKLKCSNNVSFNELYCRLQAYENTGLMPVEIANMQAENAELRRLLKLAIDELTPDCGDCYARVNGYNCISGCQWKRIEEAEKVLNGNTETKK